MKKLFITSSLALLLLAGCQEAAPSSPSTQQVDVPNTTQQTPTPAPKTQQGFTTKTLVKDEPLYKVNVTYPETGNQIIDLAIQSLINDQVDPFLKDVPTSASETPGPWSLDISYHTEAYSPEIMTFIFEVHNYTGGAHPNSFTVTKTFNLQSGREITLDDVFYPDSMYLRQVSERTKNELAEKLGPDMGTDMLEQGTAPDAKNFYSFSLAPGRITFYFDPYAVAPYAAGPQVVTLALSDFGNIVQKAFGGPETPITPPSAGLVGTIEGSMGYPSEGIPADIVVCADNLPTQQATCTDKRLTGTKYKYGIGYKLEVPAGEYYVYEKFENPGEENALADYKAYFSEFVRCGEMASCTSHAAIKVTVQAGQTVFDIQPTDWYSS